MLLGLFALVFPARCVLLPILYWCQGGGRGVAAHPDFRNLFFRLQSPPPQLAPLLASVTIVEMSPEGVSMMWGINGWAVGDNCVVFFVCEPLPCALLGRVCGQGFLLGYLLRSGDMGDFAPCNVLDFQSPFAFGCEANLDIQLVCPNVPGDWDGSLKSVTWMHLPDVSPFQRIRARRSLQSRGRT